MKRSLSMLIAVVVLLVISLYFDTVYYIVSEAITDRIPDHYFTSWQSVRTGTEFVGPNQHEDGSVHMFAPTDVIETRDANIVVSVLGCGVDHNIVSPDHWVLLLGFRGKERVRSPRFRLTVSDSEGASYQDLDTYSGSGSYDLATWTWVSRVRVNRFPSSNAKSLDLRVVELLLSPAISYRYWWSDLLTLRRSGPWTLHLDPAKCNFGLDKSRR